MITVGSENAVKASDSDVLLLLPAAPGKMAKPHAVLLNSFTTRVEWTPPADLHSTPTKSAKAFGNLGTSTLCSSSISLGHHAPVTGYRLRYQILKALQNYGEEQDNPYVVLEETWGPDVDCAILKHLTAGADYIFEVAAFNAGGQSPWSDPCDPFHMPGLEAQAEDTSVRDLSELKKPALSSALPNSITLNWNHPCHRGANLKAYEVLCSTDSDFDEARTRQINIKPDADHICFEDLVPNTVYYFKYRAVNAVGPSKWSPPTLGIATAASPPDAPDPPVRVGSPPWQSHELCVMWSPPQSCGIPIQHYSVRVSQSKDMKDAVEISVGGEQNNTVSTNQRFRPSGAALASLGTSPSSPSGRRPGFNKGHYALTQMKVKGLWPSLTYYFQVKAANQIGESSWSSVSAPMETAAAPPGKCGKPTFISGSRVDGFSVRWAAPDFLGHKDGITGFNFQVASNATFINAQELSNITSCKQVPTGGAFGEDMLEHILPCTYGIGIDHFFRVQAFGPAGVGAWSVASDAMRAAAEVPLRPDPPCEFRPMQKSVLVRWKATSDQGSKVFGYRLRYDTRSEMLHPTELGIARGSDVEATVPGLQQGCKYYFQVCAVNAVGRSAWSISSEPVVLRLLPPAKMAAPHLVASAQNSLTIGFTPPLGAKTGECTYVVRHSCAEDRLSSLENAEDKDINVIQDARPDSVTVTGLLPGKPCAFQVYAVNDAGMGELSDVTDLLTDPALPDVPLPPDLAECTAWSFCLNIKPGNGNGSPITHYNLEGHDIDNDTKWETGLWEAIVRGAGPVEFYSVNRLSPGTHYRFRIFAVNALGRTDWSVYSETMRTNPQPPAPVAASAPSSGPSIYTSDVTARTFRLHWTCPPDNGAPVTEYMVQWSINRDFTGRSTKQFVTKDLEAFCDECTPGTFIYARVAAANSEGYGKFGPEIKQLMDTDVPVVPGRPKVLEVGPTHISVGWLYPFDCGKKVFASWLQYTETDTDGRSNDEKDKGELLIDAPGRSCRIEPLFSGREYVFSVAVENEHGLGLWSEPSIPQRVAFAQVPTAPGEPDFIESTTSEISIRWTVSDALGSDVVDQLILASIYPDFPEDKTIQKWVPFDPEPAKVKKDPYDLVQAPAGPPGPRTGRPQNGRSKTQIIYTPCAEMQEKRKDARKGEPVESSQNFGALVKKRRMTTIRTHRSTVFPLDPGTYYYFKVASRNGIGLGSYGLTSERFPTKPAIPDPIPDTPGIELLRKGCTTLTVGWQRPVNCRGAPVTHYIVRYAEDKETLWSERANEFEHEETVFHSWDGQVIQPPEPAPVEKADLQDKESVLVFMEYLMVRFGGLDQAWEWLDVNGNGDVSSQEFLEGDVDNGPPFGDFDKDILGRVWKLLDSDGGGDISMNEFNKLRPYMNEVSKGSSGIDYKGVYCLIPNLLPAMSYHMMVRAKTAGGVSSWVECASAPHKTLCMTPMQMKPVEGVRKERACNSVLLRWTLPWDSGEPLIRLELRWVVQEVDDAVVDAEVLRSGQLEVFFPDPETGKIQTEFLVGGLLPGQLVLATGRGYNISGGARVWSEISGPGAGASEHYWDWDTCSASAPPDAPTPPRILESSLVSLDSSSKGDFDFSIGRLNGRKLTKLQFQLYDETEAVVQDWTVDAKEIDGAATAPVNSQMGSSFDQLLCGVKYAMRARLFNPAGASDWSAMGVYVRMPPDAPQKSMPVLSEFSSPTYIEVKWKPPHHNGAEITKFELRISLSEDAGWDEWRKIDDDVLVSGTKEYGHDGRRKTERDAGYLLYKTDCDGTELEPNIRYYFKIRAYNSVGWGEWSAPSGFLTKPVRPGKTDDIRFVSSDKHSVSIEWVAPICHGKEVLRYDLFASINKVFLNWIWLTTTLLSTTVDSDKIFSTDQSMPIGGAEYGEEVGKEDFDKLFCDHGMYVPLLTEQTSYTLEGLLPGQDCHFIIRAVNCVGKGEFSNITAAFKTHCDTLGAIEPLTMQCKTEFDATVAFRLPHNFGCKIEEVALTLRRLEGPLSGDEIDSTTGNCHSHLSGQNHSVKPSDLESFPPKPWSGMATVSGGTPALRRALMDEDLVPFTEHLPTFMVCTGKVYHFCFEKLRPGTSYEATWSCRSSLGWSQTAEAIVFSTEASVPDDPVPLVIHGL